MKGKANKGKLFLILLLAGTIFTGNRVSAQQNNTHRIMELFGNIQEAYKKAGSLSCNLKYTYASESAPAVHLDSVAGKIEMHGENYRFLIDNTETIQTTNYTLLLFKDDKIMYISRPSIASKGKNPGPLAIMDSAFSGIKDLSWDVQVRKNLKIISIVFPQGMMYKKIDFTLDTLTGYITKIVYLVRTEQLMDPSVPKNSLDPGIIDKYALVEASFYGYSRDAETAAFDEHNFFTKEGDVFKTTEKYKEFKIFKGSPNL